uniref:Uncharacterized protein n=1 Tax=Populus trichocarpa TaxID=3694 RepID=A9PA54_POPTR|nr:unknown [Populus trichocarpa]
MAAPAVFFSCSRLCLSHGLPLPGRFGFSSLPIDSPIVDRTTTPISRAASAATRTAARPTP